MKKASYYNYNNACGCTSQCGSYSCEKMYNSAYTAFGAVCAFLLALLAIIISGAVVSVIICAAIISVIIISRFRPEPKEVYLL